jgi:hypothetical protein
MKEKEPRKWTRDERAMYRNLRELCGYIEANKGVALQPDTLFKRYVYFDYVLNDTMEERRQSRMEKFDKIFYPFRHLVDSIGLEKLDAKPIRFFKGHDIYKPFKNKEMSGLEQDVFVYYLKSAPKKPIGTLWMDRKTKKLIAWILINQGGVLLLFNFQFAELARIMMNLVLENKLDTLHSIYESIYQSDQSADWRRSSIEYFSSFPKTNYSTMFKSILEDESEDFYLKRLAALGLGRLKDESSVDLIILGSRKESHNSDQNTVSFLIALSMIKGSKAKFEIEKYKSSKEPKVRDIVNEILLKW